MGAALTARLTSNLNASGLDVGLVAQLLDPSAGTAAFVEAGARSAMAGAIHLVFLIGFVAGALGWISAIFTPRRELKDNPLPIAPATAD